jgi:hypothetical protein
MLHVALSVETIRRENQFPDRHDSPLIRPASGSPLGALNFIDWIAEEARKGVWPQLQYFT